MNNLDMKIYWSGAGIVIICTILLISLPNLTYEVGTEEVPCYDNQNNLMKDIVCIEKEYVNNYEGPLTWILFGLGFGFFLVLVGLILVPVGGQR